MNIRRIIINIFVFAFVFCSLTACMNKNNYKVEIITDGVDYKVSQVRTPLPVATYIPYGMEEGVLPMAGFYGPEDTSSIEGNKAQPVNRQEVYDLIA